jgi:hypothetical protein
MLIKTFEPILSKHEESYFKCVLINNTYIEIPFWSFYEYTVKKDENLKQFALKFDEWEGLTLELTEFGYDFKTKLDWYLQQFSDEEMEDFCFPIEE